jgi:hypothetical protein
MEMHALKLATLEAVKAVLADAMAELYELRAAVDSRTGSTSRFSGADETIAGRRDSHSNRTRIRRIGS